MRRVSRWRITMLVQLPSDEWSQVWTYDTPLTPAQVLVIRELENAIEAFEADINGGDYPSPLQLKITEIRKDTTDGV